jgi:hypothetical protein
MTLCPVMQQSALQIAWLVVITGYNYLVRGYKKQIFYTSWTVAASFPY